MKTNKIKKRLNSFEERSFYSISKFILSSFILILFFYISPIIINIADKILKMKNLQMIQKKF